MDTLLASGQTRRGRLSLKGKEAVCGGLRLLTGVDDGWAFGRQGEFRVLGALCLASFFLPEIFLQDWIGGRLAVLAVPHRGNRDFHFPTLCYSNP